MIALNIAIFAQGHPISFRTLGTGVKINRFPNTVRWNALERQQSFDFSLSQDFVRTAAKFQILCLMTLFQAAICRKDRLCANYHAMQKKFGKKIFNFIPKVFFAKRFSTSFQRFFLLAFYKPVTIISDLPPS